MKVAVLVDGGFFIKRCKCIFDESICSSPSLLATKLHEMALQHLQESHSGEPVINVLYRIFYYDSWPFEGKEINPISRKLINFAETPIAKFRIELFNELKKKRKVALRLGLLKRGTGWQLFPQKIKRILNQTLSVNDLNENDIFFSLTQKRVDIKIGLDIASLAYKKQVDKIVLISGDSDFIPATKVARREGIDFILDPMWNRVHPDLLEHIDGLKSVCPKP